MLSGLNLNQQQQANLGMPMQGLHQMQNMTPIQAQQYEALM